jgi:hypothetical protein
VLVDLGDILLSCVNCFKGYTKAIIEGPLGPTYSSAALSIPIPTSLEPIEDPELLMEIGPITPPLVDDPCFGNLHPVTEPPNAGHKLLKNMGKKSTSSHPAPPSAPNLAISFIPGKPLQSIAGSGSGTGKDIDIPPVSDIPPTIESLIEIPVESPIISPIRSLIGSQTIGPGITPAVEDPLRVNFLTKAASDSYREYRKKEADMEQKRVEAYTHNGSIFQDGEALEIPQFGPPFEGSIAVPGGTTPIIFTAMTTPTENVDRDKKLEALERIVLERLEYCGVCQEALPIGPHNLEVRKRHFQDHKDIEDEYKRNIIGSFSTVAQLTVREAFYCEYCGKSTAEFERDTRELKHGPSCAPKAAFNDVPQYCQYCRLNFWNNNMTNQTVLSHVRNCANIRRGELACYLFFLNDS